ncbi:unnamed protein product, partial [Owenia fusiformis]
LRWRVHRGHLGTDLRIECKIKEDSCDYSLRISVAVASCVAKILEPGIQERASTECSWVAVSLDRAILIRISSPPSATIRNLLSSPHEASVANSYAAIRRSFTLKNQNGINSRTAPIQL